LLVSAISEVPAVEHVGSQLHERYELIDGR
jgi:hypothetical protein